MVAYTTNLLDLFFIILETEVSYFFKKATSGHPSALVEKEGAASVPSCLPSLVFLTVLINKLSFYRKLGIWE